MMVRNKKRDLVWRHNSFFGHASMARANMNSIIYSETATTAAKTTANEIWHLLRKLEVQLKERVDVDSL